MINFIVKEKSKITNVFMFIKIAQIYHFKEYRQIGGTEIRNPIVFDTILWTLTSKVSQFTVWKIPKPSGCFKVS